MHASIQLYCYYTVSIAKRNFAKSSKQNYDLSSTPKTVRMGCPHFTVYPAPREGMSKLSYLVHSPTSLFFFLCNWTIPATWLPSVESQVEWLEICCKRKALMGARDWVRDSHRWLSSSNASSLPFSP